MRVLILTDISVSDCVPGTFIMSKNPALTNNRDVLGSS